MSELEKEVFRAIEEADMDEGDLKRILGIAEGVKLQREKTCARCDLRRRKSEGWGEPCWKDGQNKCLAESSA